MPVLRLFFYSEMGKAVYDFDMFLQKILKKYLFCDYFCLCDGKRFVCDYLQL